MKQLPPYTMSCKTQITLIFKNTFKAASPSSYVIVTVKILELLNKQPPYLIKNLPKITYHSKKLFHHIERTKMTYFLWRKRSI